MGHPPEEFEAAIEEDIERPARACAKSLRDVQNSWVKDMKVLIEDGTVRAYNVNLEVTFVLHDET